jgi:hypothetical protein
MMPLVRKSRKQFHRSPPMDTSGSGVAGDRPVPSRRATVNLRNPPPRRGHARRFRLPEWTISSPPAPPEPTTKLVRGGLGGYPRFPEAPVRERRASQRFSGTDLYIGEGIELDDSGRIKLGGGLVEGTAPIEVAFTDGAYAVSLDLATDPGLENSSGLRVKVKAAGGITRDADGLSLSTSSLGSAIFTSIQVLSLTGSTVSQVKFDDPDVTHGFTALSGSLSAAEATTTGLMQTLNTSNGGLLFAGFRSSVATALSFQGHIGSTTPTGAGVTFAGYKSDGGTSRADMSGSEIIASFLAGATNRFNLLASGQLLVNTTTVPTGQTTGIVLGGGTSTPVLGAATADIVSIAGVDNGAGNRELQVQPESGGILAYGNNTFRRQKSSTQHSEQIQASVNTTDATVTTLATIAVSASYTYLIEARIVARRTGGAAGTADDGASYVRRGTYTTKTGTVTLMGAVEVIGTDREDQAGWDATLDISTTNVRVRVTGAVDNNVTWMADVSVVRVSS